MSFPRYPKYKDSGVEWLGEVPEHWEVKRLKRSCYTFPSNVDKKSYDDETRVMLCNYTDVYYNDVITAGLEFMIATASIEQIKKFTLRAGDTIITKDSETADDIAIAAYVPEDLPGVVCGYHLSMIRPKTEICGAFVKRLFDSTYAKACFAVLANGLTRVGLGQYELNNVELPFPPESEQTAIAAFLDRETAKIDALVAEQQRLMELLKEKRQAVISHAVTRGLNPAAPLKDSGIEWLGQVPEHWRVGKCGYYTEILCGFAFPSSGFSNNENNAKLLRGINVGVSRLKWDETVYWERTVNDDLDVYEMNAGDLVIGMDRPLISDGIRVAKVKESDLPCLLLQRVASLKTKESLNTDYLLALLSSEMFVAHFAPDATGVSVPHISPDQLCDFVIPIPTIHEQNAIAQYLDLERAKFDSLSVEAQRAIDLLQERRTALISAAVTGQIDVRESAAVPLTLVKPYSSGFARQLLAAEILDHCHQHPTMGRVKLQKLIHLCEHVAELEEVGAHYARKAAGPFDNKVMFGIASGLFKQKWFAELKDGNRTVYQPLEHAGEHRKYLTRWEGKMSQINKVLHLLGKADTQQCEIVSTLYAAWNDLLIEGQSPTDETIINEASSPDRWHENKAKIPPEKWPKALIWMREKGLVPKGFGNHTSRPN